MSKHIGFQYSSNSISKHSDSYYKETEDVFDYVKNERRRIEKFEKRTNKQTGSDWGTGFGIVPKQKPALAEGNSCTTIAKKDDSDSFVLGLKYGSRDVAPRTGETEEFSDGEVDVCPPDPKRPGLKYKRTRSRKTSYKEGDHISQSSFGVGFNW